MDESGVEPVPTAKPDARWDVGTVLAILKSAIDARHAAS
jgi:hypothetical protein